MDYKLDYEEFIDVNGDSQSIRVRSTDESLPVMLFLHGGPGLPDRHTVLGLHSSLGDAFTLVCWDQRASGRSFRSANLGEELTLDILIEDARAVTEYLLKKFNRKKLYIAAHSWGTVLGFSFIIRYPDYVEAYAGTGQFVHGARNEEISHAFCLDTARETGDEKAIKRLLTAVPKEGVYPSPKTMRLQRTYLAKYGGAVYKERKGLIPSLLAPLFKTREYKLWDIPGFIKGALFNTESLSGAVVKNNFIDAVKKFPVPVLILQGRHDYNTPSELALEWFEALDAPAKRWVWFEESAHSPIKEEPERWEEEIRKIGGMI